MVRHYHGHLSAVQDLALHPTLDILVTCARDSTARVYFIFIDNFNEMKILRFGICEQKPRFSASADTETLLLQWFANHQIRKWLLVAMTQR